MSGFYIELPADRHGNLSMPPAVVEARIVQGGPEHAPWVNPDRKVIIFAAPPEMAGPRKGCYEDAYGGWAETQGPARMLTFEEHQALVAEILAGGDQ